MACGDVSCWFWKHPDQFHTSQGILRYQHWDDVFQDKQAHGTSNSHTSWLRHLRGKAFITMSFIYYIFIIRMYNNKQNSTCVFLFQYFMQLPISMAIDLTFQYDWLAGGYNNTVSREWYDFKRPEMRKTCFTFNLRLCNFPKCLNI